MEINVNIENRKMEINVNINYWGSLNANDNDNYVCHVHNKPTTTYFQFLKLSVKDKPTNIHTLDIIKQFLIHT